MGKVGGIMAPKRSRTNRASDNSEQNPFAETPYQ
jgi:hypothetical protein